MSPQRSSHAFVAIVVLATAVPPAPAQFVPRPGDQPPAPRDDASRAPARDDPPRQPAVPGAKVPGLELTPADPRVKADEGFVVVEAKTEGKSVKWIVLGNSKVKFVAMDRSVVVSVPPGGGTVHVYAYTVIDGEPTDYALTKISVDAPPGPAPAPPGPAPPGPAPAPPAPEPAQANWATGALNVVIVDDQAQRDRFPYMASVVNSQPLRDSITRAGHRLLVLNATDPAVTKFALGPHVAQAGGVPALLIMNDRGFVGVKTPCPKDPNGVVAAVNAAIKGGK